MSDKGDNKKNPTQSITYALNGVSKSYTVSSQNDKKRLSTRGMQEPCQERNPTKSMTYVCWHGGCYPWAAALTALLFNNLAETLQRLPGVVVARYGAKAVPCLVVARCKTVRDSPESVTACGSSQDRPWRPP